MPPAALKVSESLVSLFEATTASTEEQPNPRAILVQAEENNTVLTNTATFAPAHKDRDDFNTALRQLLSTEPNRSAYVLFRLDTTAAAGSWEWLMCCYQPSGAPVREKMKYSQTKAALVNALHELNFLDIIYGQSVGDFTWPTKLRNARKIDYQNPNVGLQGRSAAQAAGASTGGVRRNFGLVGGKPQAPTSLPVSAPVPASAAKPAKPFAGATATPFSSATPAPAVEEPAPAPESEPEATPVAEPEVKPRNETVTLAEPSSATTPLDAGLEPKAEATPSLPAPAEAEEAAPEPVPTPAVPLPKTALQAGEEAEGDDEDDWDGPAALQDSRVPSPVHVGHVAEAPKLDTVDEELNAQRAAEAATTPSQGVEADKLDEALSRQLQEKAIVQDEPVADEAPTLPEQSDNASLTPEETKAPDASVPSPVERPAEPVAAILEEEVTQELAPTAAEPIEIPDISNVPAIVHADPADPTELGQPKRPGSAADSLIVEPPTPAPARSEPDVSTPIAPSTPVQSATAVAEEPVTSDAGAIPAALPSAPISVSGYGTREGGSLLTEQEATRAEVERATAAERASFAPPSGGGLGPGHTAVSFEWEDEVLPALATLPIRASGASEYNFVLLSLNLTAGQERVELAAPPRFLPAAEVGQALDSEQGPRYARYRLEGTPIFADDAESAGGGEANLGGSAAGHAARRSSAGPVAVTGGGLLFIYSCPSTSSVRERMLYSTNLRSFLYLAEQRVAGLKVQKRVETSDPAELTASLLAAELGQGASEAEATSLSGASGAAGTTGPVGAADAGPAGGLLGTGQAFSRPKRPGGKR